MAGTVLGDLAPAVANDMTPIDLSERAFAPARGTTVQLPPGQIQRPDLALAFIIGSSDGRDVRALGPLGRIGAVSGPGDAAAFSDLPFGLEVGESVTRFEVLIGLRNPRPGGVRTHFTIYLVHRRRSSIADSSSAGQLAGLVGVQELAIVEGWCHAVEYGAVVLLRPVMITRLRSANAANALQFGTRPRSRHLKTNVLGFSNVAAKLEALRCISVERSSRRSWQTSLVSGDTIWR